MTGSWRWSDNWKQAVRWPLRFGGSPPQSPLSRRCEYKSGCGGGNRRRQQRRTQRLAAVDSRSCGEAICHHMESSKVIHEKQLLSLVSFTPELSMRVSGFWKCRILQLSSMYTILMAMGRSLSMT